MNQWMKVFVGLIIGLATLSIIGIVLNIVVGLAAFALKVAVVIAAGYIVYKVGQGLIEKFK